MDRLDSLAASEHPAVRLAALSNPAMPPRDLAKYVNVDNLDISTSAVDAVIARGSDFHHVLWDERDVLELVSTRLTDWDSADDGTRNFVIDDAVADEFLSAAAPHGATPERTPADRISKVAEFRSLWSA